MKGRRNQGIFAKSKYHTQFKCRKKQMIYDLHSKDYKQVKKITLQDIIKDEENEDKS
jgi:hypothetical protein